MEIPKQPTSKVPLEESAQPLWRSAYAVSLPRRIRAKSRYLWTGGWLTGIALMTLFAARTSEAWTAMKEQWPQLVTTVGVLLFLLTPTLLYLMTSVRRDVSRLFGRSGIFKHAPWPDTLRAVVWVGIFVSVYSLYGVMTKVWVWESAVIVALFTGVPFALCLRASQVSFKPTVYDWAAVASLWLPFNFGFLQDLWVWPEGHAAYVLNTPLAMATALVGFVSVRRFPFIYARNNLRVIHFKTILPCLLLFIAVALPVGFSTGFLAFNPRVDVGRALVAPLGIFFFIALPEELFFRSIIMGLLHHGVFRRFGEKTFWIALIVSSLLFGISHWHDWNASPPWTYISLASLAGIMYGWTYAKTRSLVAAAILHMMVDVLWEWFFRV